MKKRLARVAWNRWPSSVTEKLSLDGFSGLMLMGGSDVNPARYGATPQTETDAPDDERGRPNLTSYTQPFNATCLYSAFAAVCSY